MAENESTGGAFAKYRPIAELGQGGMAQVFLAMSSGPVGFNKLVVIKQIREQFAEDPEFLTMFLDEARLAARLNHPNVVQTNEVGGDGKRFFICMEYLEGQPLNRILSRVGVARGLTLGMQLRVLVDALAGLHHAHELCDFDGRPLQVVHRDATPHNIFVTYAGQVKVVDFGIAKALSSSSETRTGVLKGKVAYMAPEQAMGEKVDRRADIFSMGMILWEMLVGKRLFKGMPDVAVLQKIVNGTVPSPSTANPDVSAELERVCMKALTHARDDRYATAADMAADLEKAVDDLGLKGSSRDTGKLIETFFASEREKIKQLVEAQTTQQRMSDPGTFDPRATGSSLRLAKLPVLDHPTTEPHSGRDSGSGSGSIHTRTSSGSGRGEDRAGSISIRRSSDAPASLRGDDRSNEPSHPSSLTASMASPLIAPPPAPQARGRLYAVMGAGAVGAAVAIGFFATRGGPPSAPAAQPTATATAEAAVKLHTISVDSMPQGATIREGDKELGKTPMLLQIDPAAPPRKLVMSLEGYAPHTFLPTVEDPRIQIPLAAIPATQPAAATDKDKPAHAAVVVRGPAAPAQTTAPPPPAPKLDINTVR
jgi:eukaryotic-like serine/threonine-protein kinase